MARPKSAPPIRVTKDYGMFGYSGNNRDSNFLKHKTLKASMERYGFLREFPIICRRESNSSLIVEDGQHRLAFAETLGLPVYWIESTVDFDVAIINSTPKVWSTEDYAKKYAKDGIKDYQEALEFSGAHQIPLAHAFCLLAGYANFFNIVNAFRAGEFKIKDREWANKTASVFGAITNISKTCRRTSFLIACMAICRVDELNIKRLVRGAERQRDKLVAYSTKEANLDLLEELYNYGRKQLFGLKSAAKMAMRERDACVVNARKRKAKMAKAK